MTALSGPIKQAAPQLTAVRHASAEEYAALVSRCTNSLRQRKHLLGCRDRFVRHYPDLRQWFQAPLSERVGRLHGEPRAKPTCLVCYQARRYLSFWPCAAMPGSIGNG